MRTGELVAVKVGPSYDISEAAIEQFRRQRPDLYRDAQQAVAVAAPRVGHLVAGGLDALDALDALRTDLDHMLQRTTLTAQPVFDRLVRHAASAIGDGCVLRLVNDDGVTLRTVAVAHVEPTAHTLLAAMQDSPLPLAMADEELSALRSGTLRRVDFLRQDVARRMMPREFVQYADQLRPFGLLAVPVRTGNGMVVGLLTVLRNSPGRSFDADAQLCAHELADWAGAAHQRLAETRACWKARSSIHRATETALAIGPAPRPAQLSDLLTLSADPSVAAAALTTDGTLVATNPAFGVEFASVLGDASAWDRLLGGDTDFLDTHVEVAGARIDAHWAVAKNPDATPVVVIVTCTRTVARPLALTTLEPTLDASFGRATFAVAS